MRVSDIALDLRALGEVPGDGFTLPVLSPDGRFLAVQTGAVPELATLLARPGARRPLASRIAYYRIAPESLTRLGETEPGLVLGRAADEQGFLVESPRPDGARWIGRVRWMDGELEWLVQDGNVNAFGTMGPGGTLAYSSRAVGDAHFDLVVERGGGRARLSGDGTRSLLLPIYSADGSRILFASLRDGVLELGVADPSSAEAMRQSLVRTALSDRANDETAFQMLAPQGVRDGADGGDWLFFHPLMRAVVRWNETDGPRPLATGALAVSRIDAARTAVLVGDRVRMLGGPVARSTAEPRTSEANEPGALIHEGVAVPRAFAPIDGAPALLLIAPRDRGFQILLARIASREPQPRK